MSDNLREYEGGQTIEIPVTLASIPMFLRGSAIVATSEDVKHILRDTMHQLDLLVAAETDTSFVLYDDDGHTEDYKNGVYAKTTIDVKAGDRTDIHFSTEGTYESPVERMTIKLVSKKKGAFWASVDGRAAHPVHRPRWLGGKQSPAGTTTCLTAPSGSSSTSLPRKTSPSPSRPRSSTSSAWLKTKLPLPIFFYKRPRPVGKLPQASAFLLVL